MEEDEFDKELENLIKDAMDERDSELDDESGNSGEETREDGEDESEEDNSGIDGDRNEDDNQEGNEKDSVDFEPIEVEVSGVKVVINSKEEMLAYVKKGASTFNVEQDRFTEEKTILEQGKISADDLKLLVDAKNGSKEALALLARKANIDILDVESEMADSYTRFQRGSL